MAAWDDAVTLFFLDEGGDWWTNEDRIKVLTQGHRIAYHRHMQAARKEITNTIDRVVRERAEKNWEDHDPRLRRFIRGE